MSPRLDKVHYHTVSISIDAIFGPLLRKTDELFSAFITHAPIPDTTMGYFLWAAPLFKHQGFREENEVRMIGIPGTPYDLRALQRQHPGVNVPPLKTIRSRMTLYGNAKYIALFETLSCKLPIKRVIVGPSRDQRRNYKRALKVVGKAIPLVCSETPFLA